MADKILKELTLKIWRQKDAKSKGGFETYKIHDISTGSSFLEMLDILNEQLVSENKEPVAFDHDCREGICGTCSLFIDGRAHGPDDDVTTCQLHMRRFEDGATITIEPWRCGAFPVIKDLIVDRGAYEKILQAGGYVSVNTGGVPDGNAIPIAKPAADEAMDAAACIGCGACKQACPVGIPLHLMTQSMMEDIQGEFGVAPGAINPAGNVLSTFKAEDKENFIH